MLMNLAGRRFWLVLALSLGLGSAANAQAPALAEYVMPTYPQIAHSARVEGVVELGATVDSAGRVTTVLVNRSVPLLDQAAIDAVRQWQFASPSGETANVTVTVRFSLNDPFRYPRPATYRQPLPSWIPGNFAFVYQYECQQAKVEIDSIERVVTNSNGLPATLRRFPFNFDLDQASDVYVALVGEGFYDPSTAAAVLGGDRRTWKEVAPVESGIQQTGDRIIVRVAAVAPILDTQNVYQIQWFGRDQPPRRVLHSLRVRGGDSWTEFRWIEPVGANRPAHEKALAVAGQRIRALVKKNLTDARIQPSCL